MARPVRLLQLSAQGPNALQRIEIGSLSGEEIPVGREPGPGGLTLPSQAISRQHGVFTAIRNYWFYRDLDSTNGTWLNGVRLEPNKWTLVKVGDSLQFADLMVEVAPISTAAPFGGGVAPIGIRSLVVFSRGQFLDEYPVPEYGRALVIGGQKADLRLDIDVHELPSAVFERRGDSVCVFTISTDVPVYCNGSQLTQTVVLSDRDEVRVDHYTVIFNDVVVPHGESPQPVGAFPGADAQSHMKGKPTLEYQAENSDTPEIPWEGEQGEETQVANRQIFPWQEPEQPDFRQAASQRSAERSVFGKVTPDDDPAADETIALGGSFRPSVAGTDIHPAMRSALMEQSESPLISLEDKIWLAVGLAMVLALVALVIWWMIS